jgi:hypothetical protein
MWLILRRRRSGHPWLFVIVCALLAGAVSSGAWVLVVLLTVWALLLLVRTADRR